MNTRKLLSCSLLIGLFFATSVMAAGNSLSGTWQGTGTGIYPGGTIAAGIWFEGEIHQDKSSGLFSGVFTFEDPELGLLQVCVSGYADQNGKLTGLFSLPDETNGCYQPRQDHNPPTVFGAFEGKASGNKISGVVRGLFDASTSVLSGTRVR